MANKSPVNRQSASNPAGGGDVRGLGETFQPDLNSGVGNYRVPLDLLPGIRNFQPSLALGYSTGAGNGAWGLGWSLPFAAISRRTFRGTPSYTDDDTFLFAGQTELLPVGSGNFRASIENGFEQFSRTASGWQVTEKSGMRHTFGTTAESRIEFDDNGTIREFAWLIERTEDTAGNTITYRYRTEQGQRYIDEIRYAVYVIRFEYEARPDLFSDFRSGFDLRTALRCSRITLHVDPLGPAAVRTWALSYDTEPFSGLSLLRSVTFSGHDPETGESAALPPLEFSYTEFAPSSRRLRKFVAGAGAAPPGLDQPNLELIDLDGRGLPGILSIENGVARYWSNTGGLRWGPPRSLPQFPAVFSTAEDRVQFADMDGNGAADVLVGSGTLSGFYRNEGTGAFADFNQYVRQPQLAFETGGLQLMDVNGDGLVDAVHDGSTGLQVYDNLGSAGWKPPRLVPKDDLPTPVPNLSSGDPRIRVADINGDGLADVVLFSSGYFEYWPSRGGGHFSESRKMTAAPRFPYPFDPARVFIVDIDGDGLADVVFVGYDEVTYWINQSGNSFSAPQTIRYTPPTSRADTLRIADMSGTGTAGILWTSPYPDYRYLDFTGDVKPGLLSRIDNGLGRITAIEYTTSTGEATRDRELGEPWTSFLPFPVQVVSAVTVDDSISGLHNVTRYRYHEGHYDGHRREFDGFGRSEQIEEGDDSIPSCRTVFHYHTEASGRPTVPDPELRRSLKRKLFRVEIFGEDGGPLAAAPYRVEESRWTVRVEQTLPDSRRVLFPFIEETTTSTFERTPGARIERRLLTFDISGNVTSEERSGEGGAGVPIDIVVTTHAEYALDLAGRVRDRVSRIVQRDGDGNLLNEVRQYYDGAAFQGLALGQVTNGLLTRTEKVALHKDAAASTYGAHEPDFSALEYHDGEDQDGKPAWLYDHRRISLDERGNVLVSRDARGNDTLYTFDEFGLFATSITDAKGFVATVEHDLRVARPRRMVNPNGGVTESRYDPLARIAVVAAPGDTLAIPTVTYSYETTTLPALRAAHYRVLTGDTRTISVNEYLDGAGALFQRRTEHDGDMVSVSGQVVPNARGKTAEKFESFYAEGLEFEPYSADPSAPRRSFFFDPLGRAIRTLHPDGGQSGAEYGTFDTLFSDAGDNDPGMAGSFGTPRREIYDAWYRLMAVEERDQTSVRATSYELDATGRLRQITDPRGVVLTRINRDLTGQEISIDHVDAGHRLLAYDAGGNLALQVDGAGEPINRSYDELNRIIGTAYGGAEPETYFYDAGAGANLTGRLARSIDPAGETTYSYDSRGNVIERSRMAPGQTEALTLTYSFDRIGRMTRLTYPDEAAIDFEYYSGFLLRRIPGCVNAIEYTAAGVRTGMDYQNGVRTEYGYDPASLRLREIRTFRPDTGAVYFHTRYDISTVGNVASIEDLRPGTPGFVRTQSFGYDAFHNLLEASSPDPAAGYSHIYEYDAAANFIRNPLISPNPLLYENNGNSNRLSGYVDSDGITPVNLFGYDLNGNVESMPGRTFTFDVKQQLARVQLDSGADVAFFYDHKGVLSRREATDAGSMEVTHYVDNLFESRDGLDIRWVMAGDLPVARVSGGTTVFIHNDHLGSAVIYTDADGNLLTETAFHPFGSVLIAPSGTLPPAFATKRLDADIGLYYFNARWYSPTMGRFISPDSLYLYQPEQGLQEPKRLNPYAYAGNNPVRYVDPSGLGFWDVLGAIVIAIAVVVAVVAVSVLTFGVGTAIGFGTLLAYAAVAGLAGAAIGAVVGGIAYGSWEGALRGALIGFTAGANAMIGGMIFGPIIGAALGVITFLSVIPPVAKSDVYQGILGWTSYLMPMSWPGHAIGLTLFALNVVGYLVTFGQVDALRIRDMQVDWKTGNIFTVGGWVGQLDGRAFNFGAFSFVNTSRYVGGEIIPATFEHESGHMLSNAAFGFFQATRVFEGNGLDSFWERIAESNVPPGLRGTDPVTPEPDRPKIPQWG
ncbi:RHS repeat-associated core domain-containing protein [Nitrosospira sp. Nsp18]|uniref:toxin TcdB middle/N-terminal domain-containing protein n=1 Tax=Nitrosospira sp. Nsp18 TaxID=1855334 RepID=UPI0008848FE7|nr:toxin TcdB middle/N-terminal domain-containing protein [Nitrosospira sp. Nsp18]SDA20939.1 RHS repeat-associated core domain-containing protein [Nitrosospira sp. Nsp18]